MSESFRYGKGNRSSVEVHERGECEGHCPIHNPSDHPMVDFPLHWRADRGLMERICPHGVGHPDPDHMARVERLQGKEFADAEAVHGCDGCCAPAAVLDGSDGSFEPIVLGPGEVAPFVDRALGSAKAEA